MVVIALQVSLGICSNEACNGFHLLAHTQLSLFQNSWGMVFVMCRPCNVPIVHCFLSFHMVFHPLFRSSVNCVAVYLWVVTDWRDDCRVATPAPAVPPWCGAFVWCRIGGVVWGPAGYSGLRCRRGKSGASPYVHWGQQHYFKVEWDAWSDWLYLKKIWIFLVCFNRRSRNFWTFWRVVLWPGWRTAPKPGEKVCRGQQRRPTVLSLCITLHHPPLPPPPAWVRLLQKSDG